ncbi:MAG: hypothetical protein OEV92_12090 [Nitrospinota bacterium]|nr:hypothetical protein [Nitrospinota bacterium]
MKYSFAIGPIVFLFFITLSSALVLSCGEVGEGDEAGEHGGGSTTINSPGPVSTVTCDTNCSAAGACADHGGVACSQGPDTDGSVICSDGYRNSSIKYQCL